MSKIAKSRSAGHLFLVIAIFCAVVLSVPSAYAISWHKDMDSALKESKKANKPIMADFYTDWCGWCKKLDKDTYEDPRIKELAKKFVCVKIDGDKFRSLVTKYGIRGYPSVVFLDSEGKELTRVVGYKDASGMAAVMNDALSKYKPADAREKSEKLASEKKGGALFGGTWEKIKNFGTPKSASTSVSAAVYYVDQITLKNGTRFQGLIREETPDTYVVGFPIGEVTFRKSDIVEVRRLPPEESCLIIGESYRKSKNYDAALGEYKKALRANPSYVPAKDAIQELKKEKSSYEAWLRSLEKKEEKVAEEHETEQPADQPVMERASYYISLIDMNTPMQRRYSFYEFGLKINNDLVVENFVKKLSYDEEDRTATVSTSIAKEAGIMIGDRITAINGKSTVGLRYSEAEKFIGSHRHIKIDVERVLIP